MPDEHDWSFDAQVHAQQLPDVARHRPLVVARDRPEGSSSAAVVGRDDAVAGIDERRDHVLPLPPGLREAVQQYGRARAVTRGDVVQAQPGLDVRHSMSHGPSVPLTSRKRQ